MRCCLGFLKKCKGRSFASDIILLLSVKAVLLFMLWWFCFRHLFHATLIF